MSVDRDKEETARIRRILLASWDPLCVGDNPKLGEKGCSTTGVGIVTPVCEKKRRAKKNPFGGQ